MVIGNFCNSDGAMFGGSERPMVQYAVTLKGGDWTVFRDGEALVSNLSRSAAVEMAESLAFEAEEDGQPVELLVQGYTGELGRKRSGGDWSEP